MSPEPRRAIAQHARRTPGHDQRVAHALKLLRGAADRHRGRIVQSSSLGVEAMVITDLVARHSLPVVVATLDTGALHQETRALIDRVQQRYGIHVERFAPHAQATVQFVRRHGPFAMRSSIESPDESRLSAWLRTVDSAH